MQNTKKTKAFSFKRLCKKACVSILVAAMMLQTLAIPGLAFEDVLSSLLGNAQNQQSANGIGSFESDELTAQLKKDLIKYINQDLIQSIEDYELSGAVGAIISFSENSLISTFTSSDAANRMTFAEYRESSEALTLIERLSANRAGVLASLQEEGLITGVKFDERMPNEYQECQFELDVYAQAVQSKHNGETVLYAEGWPADETQVPEE